MEEPHGSSTAGADRLPQHQHYHQTQHRHQPPRSGDVARIQERSSWATAMEDVSHTIRHSISSWRSLRLPLGGESDGVSDLEKAAAAVASNRIDGDDGNSIRPSNSNGLGRGHGRWAGNGAAEVPIPMPELAPIPRPLTLMTLPTEVQLLVIRHMDFADIEHLRRTCRYYHTLASPPIVRIALGASNVREMLLSHCCQCLRYDANREALLAAEPGPNYPFSAKCVPCALRLRDGRLSRRHIGEKVTLGNQTMAWVCRWCARPVVTGAAPGHAQFHLACYRSYAHLMMIFFLLGCVQFSIGVAACGLSWRYFRHITIVFAPALVNFLLMWVCILLLLFRGDDVRTYGVTLFFELAILGIWVAPMKYLTTLWAESGPGSVPSSVRATTVLIALNMLFRLLNVLGNIILWTEYDITKHQLPKIPKWRKYLVHPAISCLVFWTYPQSVEQKYRKPPLVISALGGCLSRKFGLE